MEIIIETDSYNEKRYSRPWIACVTFETAKGEFNFGDFIGEHGDEGLLKLIKVEIGDIMARGQKDYRKARNSVPRYYIVEGSNEFKEISKKDAYLHYQKQKINHIPHD